MFLKNAANMGLADMAFAALWVVLFHIRAFSGARLQGMLAPFDLVVRSGSTGVSLFLVISGFCLYAPFAGGRLERFAAGSFFVRRIRRLAPAYYCSIAFALALNLLGGGALGFGPMSFPDAVGQVVAHALMLHTFFPGTFYALNGAYWSLGLEWQLYRALPLLIWGARRFGLAPALVAPVLVNVVYRLGLAVAVSHGLITPRVVAGVVLPNLLPGRWAEFVFGMLAAELYARGAIDRLPSAAAYAWIPLLALGILADKLALNHLVYGAAFAALLVGVLRSRSMIGRAFSWPPLVGLGIMSYSLYLVHQPIVQAMAYVLRHDAGLSPTRAFVALLVLFPVILAAAWALFVLVERRTLTSRPVEVRGWIASLLFPRSPWTAPARSAEARPPAA